MSQKDGQAQTGQERGPTPTCSSLYCVTCWGSRLATAVVSARTPATARRPARKPCWRAARSSAKAMLAGGAKRGPKRRHFRPTRAVKEVE